MPRGHATKRESKKPKKKASKQPTLIDPMLAPTEVEVIKKKRKPRVEVEEG